MEENNNQNEVKKENTSSNQTATNNKIVETIKAKKILIGSIILAIVLIIVIINAIAVSPKEAVTKCFNAILDGKGEKAMKYVDIAGAAVAEELDGDYDDFWSEYRDFKDSDDYDELIEKAEDDYNEEDFDSLTDELDEYGITMKVNKIKKVKKVSKKLYKVTASIKVTYDDDETSVNMDFYVMKKGLKSYIVSIDTDALTSSLTKSLLSSSLY